jgi:hypothetical protein
MTPEDWKFIIEGFGAAGIGAVVVSAMVYFFIRTTATSYLTEKGKNLATKEDIKEITHMVEGVKSELQARHTLRFAALDKRLDVYQEAYTCARKLARGLSSQGTKLEEPLVECRAWLDENALFLESEALSALESACQAGEFLCIGSGQMDQPTTVGFRRDILNAPNAIRKALQLPPLKEPTK